MKEGDTVNQKRLFEKMQAEHLDYLLLSGTENVSYTGGMGVPVAYGALFAYGEGMPLAYTLVSLTDQKTTLIVSELFADYAKCASAEEVRTFRHYGHFDRVDGRREICNCLEELLPAGARTRMGIEFLSCPAFIYEQLLRKGYELCDAGPVLRHARKVKQKEELDKLKKAAYIEDCGQKRLLEYSLDYHGESDYEMWSGVSQAMNEAAGKAVRISGELSVGKNTEIRTGLGGPNGYLGKAGDLGRMDISVRYRGYWCDCTNTVCFGRKPDSRQMFYLQVVREAYDAAKAKLWPGNCLMEVSAAEAAVYKKYDMLPQVYTGHQIGCGVNEPGRIVCYEREEIVPGMVVCIEPQQYGPPGSGIGVRMEKVISITERGPEELNKFSFGTDIWN